MNRVVARSVLAALLLAGAALPTQAQFGKNKISYEHFDWHVYRSPHFDVHYYPAIEPFLDEIVSYAESAYLKISRDLDHELTVRVPLIVYKTHGEFQQTNVILAELPDGVGAFAEPVQYRMVLPIDQPPDKLYKLIAHELVHIFEYSMFYDGYLGRAIRSNAPTWLMEGLASYLAQDEDNLDQMAIRDAVVNNILPPIESLNVVTFLTYRYGHAVFDYIEQEHGPEGLRSFLFEFKKVLLTGNIGKAVKESFGYELDEFNRRFNRYLRKKYFPVLLENKSPDEYGTEIGVKQRGVFTFSPTISPSGELIAALASPRLELDLLVLSADGGKPVKNLTAGWTNEYHRLTAAAFEGKRDLSWSPQADRIAAFARREDRWPLLIFNAVNGNLVQTIHLENLYECKSPMYSPDGRRIAFEGNRDGVVDIFEVDVDSGEIRNLTADDFYDANPWYSQDGKTLLYNRRIGEHWKIFQVDLADSTRKTQLTFGPHSDLQPALSADGNSIYFSSDSGPFGVFNIHEMDLTTGAITQYTDVVGGCFAPQEMAERDGERYLAFTTYFDGSFRLYRMPLREPVARTEASETLAAAADEDAEPFSPPMQLRVDEAQKSPYKLKWDVEAPSVGVGVTDDGTFVSQGEIGFTDLLGNHRVIVSANTVADFQSFAGLYANLKRRYTWGAQAYDYRDFFYVAVDGVVDRRTESKTTGGNLFFQFPFSRHYRIETSAGLVESSQVQVIQNTANPLDGFRRFEDTFATAGVSLVGDTTRYQSFGPFQGKRFNMGIRYGNQLSGDSAGDFLEYRMDFRTYKQLTRRSTLAWRYGSIYNDGDAYSIYGVGGMNQLRGFEYRDFAGSRLAYSNLELRFPLVDEMRFPVLRLVQIRGFFFVDVAAAALQDDLFYDPAARVIRFDSTGAPVKFKFWDSDNDRLQDGRASYGAGFHFRFIGGLQFNWSFATRLPYSQFAYDPFTGRVILDTNGEPVSFEAGDDGTVSEFYITFDF